MIGALRMRGSADFRSDAMVCSFARVDVASSRSHKSESVRATEAAKVGGRRRVGRDPLSFLGLLVPRLRRVRLV